VLNIPCYDSELIAETAQQSGFAEGFVQTHEEQRPTSFLYSLVTGSATISGDKPVSVQLFQAQSEVIRSLAAKGSCIIIIATDIPLMDRQLKRVANRAAHALARTGSYSGNGSGDIAIAFSTANKVEHFNETPFKTYEFIYDDNISPVFEASVECVEEALISSIYHAKHTLGVRGRDEKCLQEFLHLYRG
ncbi:MAG: P1 family peptidase, partial [Firmicutes bacterium]|nr:P1 family peptidase [Bacillota bacterium]